MLLYESNSERDLATAELINQGLEENQLCVYASVYACDESHLANISSKINDYEENICKRNLLILNLEPFYDSALKRDLTLFEEFRIQIQKELERRNNRRVVIVADCADNLFRNHCFDESELVERWWHRIYMEWIQHENQGQEQITIVCPHLESLLYKHPFVIHKHKIFDSHSIVIDIAGHKRAERQRQTADSTTRTQILIAEPEPDLQQIYEIWLRSMGFKDILITDSGRAYFDEFLKIENKSNVIVILDSHLKDIPIVELARLITNKRPDKRIILTTTLPPDSINSKDISSNADILTKPFSFSELLPLISSNI